MDILYVKNEVEGRLREYANKIEREGLFCTLSIEFDDKDGLECGIDSEALEMMYADVTVRPIREEEDYELGLAFECVGGEVKDEEYESAMAELERLVAEFIAGLDAAEDVQGYVREAARVQIEEGREAVAALEAELARSKRRAIITAAVGVGLMIVFAVITSLFGG